MVRVLSSIWLSTVYLYWDEFLSGEVECRGMLSTLLGQRDPRTGGKATGNSVSLGCVFRHVMCSCPDRAVLIRSTLSLWGRATERPASIHSSKADYCIDCVSSSPCLHLYKEPANGSPEPSSPLKGKRHITSSQGAVPCALGPCHSDRSTVTRRTAAHRMIALCEGYTGGAGAAFKD
jgi:hypothetical protein